MTGRALVRPAVIILGLLACALAIYPAGPMAAAAAQTMTAGALVVAGQVTLDNHPDAIAVDPATRRIYLASSRNKSIVVLDGTTLRVMATLERNPALAPLDDPIFGGNAALVASLYPRSVAVDAASGDIYVVTGLGFYSHTLERLDGQTRRMLAAQSLGYDGAIDGMAVDEAAHVLYIAANERSNPQSLFRFDGATLQPPRALVNSLSALLVFNVVADDATHWLFVAGTAGLLVYDGTTPQSISQSPSQIPLPVFPDRVALDPAKRALYAVEQVVGGGYGAAVLTAFDIDTARGPGGPDAARFLGAAAIEARLGQNSINPGALSLAVDPIWHRVYVADQDTGVVTAVDGIGYTGTGPAMPGAGGGGGHSLPHP